MKKLILLLLTLSVSVFTLQAQIVPIYSWAGKVGGTGNEYGDYMTSDGSGNIYVTGRFDGTCDFDPEQERQTRLLQEARIFTLPNILLRNLIWVISTGGTGLDRGYCLDVDATGNIYLAGTFAGTVDLDPGPGTSTHISAGGTDMFVAKFDSSGNFVWSKAFGQVNTEYAEAIALDGNGFFYLTGEYSSDSLDLRSQRRFCYYYQCQSRYKL